ncbi:MAG: cobalamin biosynthesis bifunctional protein CbiET, partial [Rhodobacteraceae bacterium]|nr:cobalamin biosynthesis bifunctional protein CbiET [Paracoccaceae bacterium]
MSAWLHIVGIGPALGAGLSPMALESLKAARTIICPERYHGFADGFSARVIPWREEYASIESSIEPYRGPDCTPVVMLVTGDPLWFSAGSV